MRSHHASGVLQKGDWGYAPTSKKPSDRRKAEWRLFGLCLYKVPACDLVKICEILLCNHRLIHLHQLGHASGLRHVLHGEAVCLHDGTVIILVGFAQLRWHGQLVVEVG